MYIMTIKLKAFTGCRLTVSFNCSDISCNFYLLGLDLRFCFCLIGNAVLNFDTFCLVTDTGLLLQGMCHLLVWWCVVKSLCSIYVNFTIYGKPYMSINTLYCIIDYQLSLNSKLLHVSTTCNPYWSYKVMLCACVCDSVLSDRVCGGEWLCIFPGNM